VEPAAVPHHLASIVRQGGNMRGAHRQVDAQRRQVFLLRVVVDVDPEGDGQALDPNI
jgi:hypothetical protein